jgi:hypothetical protein
LLSIAASLGLALTVVPMLGGVVDGTAWLMCILCPLLIAWPASAWQFRQAQRLKDAHGEIERLHGELSAAHEACWKGPPRRPDRAAEPRAFSPIWSRRWRRGGKERCFS